MNKKNTADMIAGGFFVLLSVFFVIIAPLGADPGGDPSSIYIIYFLALVFLVLGVTTILFSSAGKEYGLSKPMSRLVGFIRHAVRLILAFLVSFVIGVGFGNVFGYISFFLFVFLIVDKIRHQRSATGNE